MLWFKPQREGNSCDNQTINQTSDCLLFGDKLEFCYRGRCQVTRASGGTIQVTLGHGIILNKGSNLERSVVTIHNATPEVTIEGAAPVRVSYYSSRSDYYYNANWTINSESHLQAIEMRFLLFDVWNNRTKTLGATEIVDMPAGSKRTFSGRWRIYSENEAAEHYASIAYISMVRGANGAISTANLECVLEEARKIHQAFEQEQLEPSKQP